MDLHGDVCACVASQLAVAVVGLILTTLAAVTLVNVCVCRRRQQQQEERHVYHGADGTCNDVMASVELISHSSSLPNCYTTANTTTPASTATHNTASATATAADGDMWRHLANDYMNSPSVNFYRPRSHCDTEEKEQEQLYEVIDDIYLKPITEQQDDECGYSRIWLIHWHRPPPSLYRLHSLSKPRLHDKSINKLVQFCRETAIDTLQSCYISLFTSIESHDVLLPVLHWFCISADSVGL